MPWVNDREARRRSAETYGDPVYLRNREEARRRARGYCEECGHRHPRLQCDHVIPRSQGGTHDLANLRMLCVGNRSCKCHEQKTATEGGGFRSRRGAPGAPADPAPRPVTKW
jgi:5-methylcytosine-specific restriction endonuclease McrA